MRGKRGGKIGILRNCGLVWVFIFSIATFNGDDRLLCLDFVCLFDQKMGLSLWFNEMFFKKFLGFFPYQN